MIAYLIMYFVVIVGVIFNNKPRFGYFAWAVLFFFSVFRGDMVGTDTQNYMDVNFTSIRSEMRYGTNSVSSMEFLTNLVSSFIINADANPRWIVTFFSVITFISLLLLAKRSKINIAFLMMVFLLGEGYIYSFNISRQWAAIALVAYAVTYIFELDSKKSLLFFPLVLLAGGIHASSLFYMLLYIFRFANSKKSAIIILIITGAIWAFILVLNLNMPFLDSVDYYEYYMYGLKVREEKTIMGKIVPAFFVVMYLFMIKRMKQLGVSSTLPLFMFCIVINILTLGMESVAHRFFMYLTFLISIFVAKYFTIEDDKSRHTVFLVTYLLITTYLFFSSGITDEYSFSFNIF